MKRRRSKKKQEKKKKPDKSNKPNSLMGFLICRVAVGIIKMAEWAVLGHIGEWLANANSEEVAASEVEVAVEAIVASSIQQAIWVEAEEAMTKVTMVIISLQEVWIEAEEYREATEEVR